LLRRLAGEAVEVGMVYEEGLGCVRVDLVQLQQVIMNLLVNARDAMPEGGKVEIATQKAEITGDAARQIGLAVPGTYIQVTVKDTGCGMDEATQARIFDPFFTTKEQGKGVGLGLSMVYGIIQQSKGTITVDSVPQRGTAFSLYLPLVRESPTQTASIRPPAIKMANGSETLLLVEDELSVRKLLSQMLGRAGYTVLQAGNGLEALACMHRGGSEVQAVITDVVMPSMGGQELAARLLQDRPSLPILFISGYSSDFKPLDQIPGRCAFLSKPFTARVLGAKLRELLDA